MARLGTAPGLLAVNGPPGTGKTTLLRDLIAAIVVTRAERLAELPSPADGVRPGSEVPLAVRVGAARGHAAEPGPNRPGDRGRVLQQRRRGERHRRDPRPQGIGAQWLEAAVRVDYFTVTARLVHGDGAWAMVAARLGNAANRRAFTETFWWGTPGRQDGCMVDLLGRLAAAGRRRRFAGTPPGSVPQRPGEGHAPRRRTDGGGPGDPRLPACDGMPRPLCLDHGGGGHAARAGGPARGRRTVAARRLAPVPGSGEGPRRARAGEARPARVAVDQVPRRAGVARPAGRARWRPAGPRRTWSRLSGRSPKSRPSSPRRSTHAPTRRPRYAA